MIEIQENVFEVEEMNPIYKEKLVKKSVPHIK